MIHYGIRRIELNINVTSQIDTIINEQEDNFELSGLEKSNAHTLSLYVMLVKQSDCRTIYSLCVHQMLP